MCLTPIIYSLSTISIPSQTVKQFLVWTINCQGFKYILNLVFWLHYLAILNSQVWLVRNIWKIHQNLRNSIYNKIFGHLICGLWLHRWTVAFRVKHLRAKMKMINSSFHGHAKKTEYLLCFVVVLLFPYHSWLTFWPSSVRPLFPIHHRPSSIIK